MEDWEEMRDFAYGLVIESNRSHNPLKGTMGQRIRILHLDHANELFMKAFLMSRGYSIQEVSKRKLKEGIKINTSVLDLLDEDRTLQYIDCLDLVCKEIPTVTQMKDKIIRFHKIRNEIQHRSTNIPWNKGEEIESFYPLLKDFYQIMFPKGVKFPEFRS